MANTLMPKFKEAILSAGANTNSDAIAGNVKLVLVDTGAYTFSSAHQFLSDVAGGARIATSGNLASKTATNGTFASSAITITAVSGTTVEGIYLYIDTGTASTSRLIIWYDTATGLTFTPNGGDVTITPASGNWFTI